MLNVVVRRHVLSAQQGDAKLNDTGTVGMGFMRDRADERPSMLFQLTQDLGNAILPYNGEVLLALQFPSRVKRTQRWCPWRQRSTRNPLWAVCGENRQLLCC